LDKFYFGSTNDLQRRILEHQLGIGDHRFTKRANDWDLVWSWNCTSRSESVRVERFIKKQKSSRYIKELVSGLRSISMTG
jgi:putative endonuclease